MHPTPSAPAASLSNVEQRLDQAAWIKCARDATMCRRRTGLQGKSLRIRSCGALAPLRREFGPASPVMSGLIP